MLVFGVIATGSTKSGRVTRALSDWLCIRSLMDYTLYMKQGYWNWVLGEDGYLQVCGGDPTSFRF